MELPLFRGRPGVTFQKFLHPVKGFVGDDGLVGIGDAHPSISSFLFIISIDHLVSRECLCENKRIDNSNCKQYQLEDDTLFRRQSCHVCKNTRDVNCRVGNYAG